MAYVICEPCVGIKDGACAAACPVQCIYDEPRPGFPDMLFIHPIECIDCGLCVTECPVEAILHEADVPEMWDGYIELNRRYFDAR